MTLVTCVFCGENARRAKEHVFPDWLLTQLDVAAEQIPLRHAKADGSVISERRHPLSQFRYGHVCVECNNGHLSRLEGEAKRILSNLWRGRQSLAAIDAFALAMWCLKTCVMLNAASNYRPIVSTLHAKAVAAMYPPPGLFVHVGFQESAPKVTWLQSQNLVVKTHYDGVRAVVDIFQERGFNVVLGVGGILLRVVYLPVAEFAIQSAGIAGHRAQLVWPRRSRLMLDRTRLFDSPMRLALDAMARDLR